VVVDATPAERRLQMMIDTERRPRSFETTVPSDYLAPRRARLAVQAGPRLPAGPVR
jgi:hypothetical protein